MDKSLEGLVKGLETELLALKTAHPRGLGVYRFYSYSIWHACEKREGTAEITFEVADGSPGFPFLIVMAGDPFGEEVSAGASASSFSEDGRSFDYQAYYYCLDKVWMFPIKIISSVPLANIQTKEVV